MLLTTRSGALLGAIPCRTGVCCCSTLRVAKNKIRERCPTLLPNLEEGKAGGIADHHL